MSDTAKAKSRLTALNTSLDELEAYLERLLQTSLPDALQHLETLQQAKLQANLPYVAYDLIFIYLKSRGIDPRTHPVLPELDRIRQYFDKIKEAESTAPQRTTAVDKAAAERFIKHAISDTAFQPPPPSGPAPQASSSATPGARVPLKVTKKMEARAAYEQELRDADARGDGENDSEEEPLQVFDDDAVERLVADSDEDEGADADAELGPESKRAKTEKKALEKEGRTTGSGHGYGSAPLPFPLVRAGDAESERSGGSWPCSCSCCCRYPGSRSLSLGGSSSGVYYPAHQPYDPYASAIAAAEARAYASTNANASRYRGIHSVHVPQPALGQYPTSTSRPSSAQHAYAPQYPNHTLQPRPIYPLHPPPRPPPANAFQHPLHVPAPPPPPPRSAPPPAPFHRPTSSVSSVSTTSSRSSSSASASSGPSSAMAMRLTERELDEVTRRGEAAIARVQMMAIAQGQGQL